MEYNFPQGSESWHKIRNSLLLTGSNVGSALGLCEYKSRAELLIELSTGKKVEMNNAMKHGVLTEPIARTWYENKFGRKVIEKGIIVPEWDPEIGGSVDGFVEPDGMIEIKCPVRMYDFSGQFGMPKYHFAQVQFYLAVCDRKWCDYVVYTKDEVKVKRVLRDENYFTKFMYPEIRKFISDLKCLK